MQLLLLGVSISQWHDIVYNVLTSTNSHNTPTYEDFFHIVHTHSADIFFDVGITQSIVLIWKRHQVSGKLVRSPDHSCWDSKEVGQHSQNVEMWSRQPLDNSFSAWLAYPHFSR